jgi:hypothetical protein
LRRRRRRSSPLSVHSRRTAGHPATYSHRAASAIDESLPRLVPVDHETEAPRLVPRILAGASTRFGWSQTREASASAFGKRRIRILKQDVFWWSRLGSNQTYMILLIIASTAVIVILALTRLSPTMT